MYKTILSLEVEKKAFLVITMYIDPPNLPTVNCAFSSFVTENDQKMMKTCSASTYWIKCTFDQ